MKISEVVKELETIKESAGDVDVIINGDDLGWFDTDLVDEFCDEGGTCYANISYSE